MAQQSQTTHSEHSPVMGGAVAALGMGMSIFINLYPEGLSAPLWIAQLACLAFIVAGAALAIERNMYPLLHQCMVLALLAIMTAIPAWIAVGPGERSCTSNVPLLTSQTSCHVVFGFSTLLMLPILEIARRQLWCMLKSAYHQKNHG
jgi:hypothetical protein